MIGLALGLAAAGLFLHHRRRHHRCHGGRRRFHRPWRRGPYQMMAWLDTTPGQEKVLRDEAELLREKARLAREEAFAARADLAEVLRAETFDRARFDAALGRVDVAWANLKGAVGDAVGRVHDTLDARQRERLADLLASRRGGPSFGPFR